MDAVERRVGYIQSSLLGLLAAGVVAVVLMPIRSTAQTGVTRNSGSQHGQIAQGELEFRLYCSQCHGSEATGNGPVARALRKPPANLRELAHQNGGVFPEQKVRDFIDGTKDVAAHGSRDMPIWGIAFQRRPDTNRDNPAPPLSEAEVNGKIDALVNYVKSIQSP